MSNAPQRLFFGPTQHVWQPRVARRPAAVAPQHGGARPRTAGDAARRRGERGQPERPGAQAQGKWLWKARGRRMLQAIGRPGKRRQLTAEARGDLSRFLHSASLRPAAHTKQFLDRHTDIHSLSDDKDSRTAVLEDEISKVPGHRTAVMRKTQMRPSCAASASTSGSGTRRKLASSAVPSGLGSRRNTPADNLRVEVGVSLEADGHWQVVPL